MLSRVLKQLSYYRGKKSVFPIKNPLVLRPLELICHAGSFAGIKRCVFNMSAGHQLTNNLPPFPWAAQEGRLVNSVCSKHTHTYTHTHRRPVSGNNK